MHHFDAEAGVHPHFEKKNLAGEKFNISYTLSNQNNYLRSKRQ
jgi:hypothetical protein